MPWASEHPASPGKELPRGSRSWAKASGRDRMGEVGWRLAEVFICSAGEGL